MTIEEIKAAARRLRDFDTNYPVEEFYTAASTVHDIYQNTMDNTPEAKEFFRTFIELAPVLTKYIDFETEFEEQRKENNQKEWYYFLDKILKGELRISYN